MFEMKIFFAVYCNKTFIRTVKKGLLKSWQWQYERPYLISNILKLFQFMLDSPYILSFHDYFWTWPFQKFHIFTLNITMHFLFLTVHLLSGCKIMYAVLQRVAIVMPLFVKIFNNRSSYELIYIFKPCRTK